MRRGVTLAGFAACAGIAWGCGPDYSSGSDCSTCQGYYECRALCAGMVYEPSPTYDAGGVHYQDASVYDSRLPDAGAPPPDAASPDATPLPPAPTCPLDAGTPAVIASAQNTPGILTVGSTQIFWVDFVPAPATVMSAALQIGAAPVVLAQLPTGSPRGIATDDQYVYWTDVIGGTVSRVSASSGGLPETLASGQDQPIDVRVDANNVYWTTAGGGTVMSASLAGGPAVTLAHGQGEPGPLAIDAKNAYWTNLTGEVMQVPLSGGDPAVLAFGQSPVDVAVDATSVYWANDGPAFTGTGVGSAGSVAKVSLTDGTVTFLSFGVLNPARIAIDATTVYVTTVGGDYSVQSVPIVGGTPTILAAPGCGGDDPYGLAVDATNIFWSNSSTGTVLSIPKP